MRLPQEMLNKLNLQAGHEVEIRDDGKGRLSIIRAPRRERSLDEMVARIQWMLTDRQKAHLNKQLSRYIDELRKLGAGKKAADGESGNKLAAQPGPGGNR